MFKRCVLIAPNRLQVNDSDVAIDVTYQSCSSFEVYRPAQRAYIWSHKDYCRQAHGTVRYGSTTRAVTGVVFVDINTGYHERHTNWRWAAAAGSDQHGRLVAFNAITGLFDTPVNSERTIWIEGDAREIGPNTFSEDLLTAKHCLSITIISWLFVPIIFIGSEPTQACFPEASSCTRPLVFSNVMMPCGNNESTKAFSPACVL
jgi:hypothetical protein